MNTFLKITLPKLKRGAYFNLMMTIYTLAMADKFIAQKIAPLLAAFKIALDQVDKALAIKRKSEYTDHIRALNEQRLTFLSSLKAAVNGFLKADPLSADALVLSHLFKDYNIKHGMQLDHLDGLFTNLITDLEGQAAAAVKALNLQTLVADIKKSHEALQQATKERMDETNENGTAQLKEARENADKIFHQITKVIEAYTITEGAEKYSNFIDRANTEIKHYKQEALGEKVKEKIPGNNDNQGGGGDGGEEEQPQG
ncbi:MAG: DUF6261 family protein [Prevotellaceae bacterium]|jgi:hypothetical protein|nr:DUF6261 family protein [Prevotellaceae bacterium]